MGELAIPAGLTVGFLVLCVLFLDFVLDDAYITFRYARNLADGHGVVWNVGEDPVEGTTSMLWVLLTAWPHLVGLPAPAVAKGLGIAATVASIWLLYGVGRARGVQPTVLLACLAPLGLSPAVAFLSLQGMETSVAALLALVAGLAGIQLHRRDHRGWAWTLAGSLLLCMLARPDLALYAGGLLAGLLYTRHRARGKQGVAGLAAPLGLGLVLPGALYMAWRTWYFGYLLPNTFYIKAGGGTSTFVSGGEMVLTFFTALLGPALFLALLSWLQDPGPAFQRVEPALPILAGAAPFLALGLFVAPIQGFLWRFQAPVLPALLLVVALVLHRWPRPMWSKGASLAGRDAWRGVVGVLLLAGLVVFPLHTLETTADEYSLRHQGDRVAAGEALAPFQGAGYRMFVSESGAVPYHSQWEAVDMHGLNSEHIAHQGLTAGYLEDYDPHLVMFLSPAIPGLVGAKSPAMAAFLEGSGHELVAVTEKTKAQGKYHLYFLDPSTAAYEEVACALLTMDAEQADRELFVRLAEIPVHVSQVDQADCH